MALANVTKREFEAFGLFNTDENLLVDILTKVKRPDGDLFAHIFGHGKMKRLNVVIFKDL